jgi:lauroyl/myristoyl acyltransferase
MPSKLQQLMRSSFGVKVVTVMGQLFPLPLGRAIADLVAKKLAGQKDTPMTKAIRANQRVIHDGTLTEEELDQAVLKMYKYSSRNIFDLYHYLNESNVLKKLIIFDEASQNLIKRSEFEARGLMITGIHLSNFDLALHWLCRNGAKPLILTIPNIEGSYRTEFEIRKKSGMNIVPSSIEAFRMAIHHLEKGGTVLSGIDRPIPDPKIRPLFFGLPSALPTHSAYLAKKAGVPVAVITTIQKPDGKLSVNLSEPIEMESYPNRELETLKNSEKILKVAEQYIRQVPYQWTISLPVWPETLN